MAIGKTNVQKGGRRGDGRGMGGGAGTCSATVSRLRMSVIIPFLDFLPSGALCMTGTGTNMEDFFLKKNELGWRDITVAHVFVGTAEDGMCTAT